LWRGPLRRRLQALVRVPRLLLPARRAAEGAAGDLLRRVSGREARGAGERLPAAGSPAAAAFAVRGPAVHDVATGAGALALPERPGQRPALLRHFPGHGLRGRTAAGLLPHWPGTGRRRGAGGIVA